MNLGHDLAASLAPLTSRVRVDVTAVKHGAAQAWTREPLTMTRLIEHVVGGRARGCSQIPAGDDRTRVAVLDFDSHKGEVSWAEMSATVIGVIDAAELGYGLRAVPWRSSGGRGVHLYFLWDEPQDAYSVRALLGEVLAACGLKNGAGGLVKNEVEIFPKQNSVAADGFGNQVIVPLAGKSVPLVVDRGEELA